jgi:hypothetical protein
MLPLLQMPVVRWRRSVLRKENHGSFGGPRQLAAGLRNLFSLTMSCTMIILENMPAY